MEGHQAGQEEMLVRITVKADSLEAIHRPRGSPADHSCRSTCRVALGAVMGLVIGALVTGFVLYLIILSKQDAPPSVLTTLRPIKSDEPGLYDIWTVDKSDRYLIYGWVKFSDGTSEDAALWLISKGQPRRFPKFTENKTDVFFFSEYLLAKGMTIRMSSGSNFTDSLFHVYRL